MQTKWDGAPSVICGTDPKSGMFFVGTKSVFAKTQPKICFVDSQIDEWYEGDLAEKLKYSLKYFSQLGIRGVIQGDLIVYKMTILKRETINGENSTHLDPTQLLMASLLITILVKKQVEQK